MKKLFVLMTTIIAAFGLVACGGEEKPAAETNKPLEEQKPAEEQQQVELEMVTKEFGHISLTVPNVFGEVEEKEGFYVSNGPNASITVSPVLEVELLPSEWDESLAAEAIELYHSGTYSNMELAAYEGDVNMNGNTAVYYAFYGTNAQGKERLVHSIRLFNTNITAQYFISLIHFSDDELFNADLAGSIINSITLSPEAQDIVAEQEH